MIEPEIIGHAAGLHIGNVVSFRIGGAEEAPCPWCGSPTFDSEIHRCRDNPARRSTDRVPNPEGTTAP